MVELSVIIPTYNERDNLQPLIECLEAALLGVDFEVIVVDDDSPDHTASVARWLAQQNSRVRVLHRMWRKGLSSATVEGILSSSAPYIAVMDADMQHDERILPAMLRKLKAESLDVVVGTRNAQGGGMGEFSRQRIALSEMGRRLSCLVSKAEVSDPMSGYFVATRLYFQEVAHSLSCTGFKILLDLIASSERRVRIGEVPYVFRKRTRGESKLDILVGLEYLQLLLDKTLGGWLPVTYLIFSLVGCCGLVANEILVYLFLHLSGTSFYEAQAISGLLVIGMNFVMNNRFTFRSSRLRGGRFMQGLGAFYLACSIGLTFNLTFVRGFRDVGVAWYLASLAGVTIGSVWNYWIASLFIWRIGRRRASHLRSAYEPSNWLAESRHVPAS